LDGLDTTSLASSHEIVAVMGTLEALYFKTASAAVDRAEDDENAETSSDD
jgi:hypothetical protein